MKLNPRDFILQKDADINGTSNEHLVKVKEDK